MSRIPNFLLVIPFLLALGGGAALPAAQPPVGLDPAPCMFTMPPGAEEGVDVTCGYLSVPSNHANPDGPRLQLAVAVVKSRELKPKPDPIFMAQGGPGGSTLETYGPALLAPNRIRTDRDIVLLEQRGTLYSKPSLHCDEFDRYMLDNLNTDLPVAEYDRLSYEATIACLDRLRTAGIPLDDFNSFENARDIEDLRLALGYDRINLYGVSYGTLLAQDYMRLFPQGLRSVILDGVVAPQLNIMTESYRNEDRAFRYFFDACREDAKCNGEFPDLEKVFYGVVDRLDKSPASLVLRDFNTGEHHPALIDGQSFRSNAFQMLYAGALVRALPRIIYLADRGDFSTLGLILPLFVFDRSLNYGMYFSVMCAEDSDYRPGDIDLRGVDPRITANDHQAVQFLDVCSRWDVPALGPEADAPVSGDVPVLLLSGGFDPVTPETNAALVASTLSHAYRFTFPYGAHGQLFDNPCADGMVTAFWSDPSRAPNSSCMAEYRVPHFVTSDRAISLGLVRRILELDMGLLPGAGLLALGLLGLLSTLLVLPLAWLWGLARTPRAAPLAAGAQPEPHSGPVPGAPLSLRLAGYAALINGVVVLTFWIALGVVFVQMISANDDALFFGLPGSARPWLILPWLSFALTLLQSIWILRAWGRGGSLLRRLYCAALAACGLICALAFFALEIPLALFH